MASFWEARAAALEGKKVKRVGTKTVKHWQKHNFTNGSLLWTNEAIAGEWEIVEEPETIKRFINVYLNNNFEWVVHEEKETADKYAYECRASCIELVVDETGKFISGRNV